MLFALTLLLSAAPKVDAGVPWLADSLPLQLSVRAPEDLAFKAAAERQYLVFNLLAGGKQAWDRGDFEGAATRWEALLRTPNLPPELDTLVRPLAIKARARLGGEGASMPEPLIERPDGV